MLYSDNSLFSVHRTCICSASIPQLFSQAISNPNNGSFRLTKSKAYEILGFQYGQLGWRFYRWLQIHSYSHECPVCKALIQEEKLVPIYGRGKTSLDPRSQSIPGVDIPSRPAGQRPETAPEPDANPFNHRCKDFMMLPDTDQHLDFPIGFMIHFMGVTLMASIITIQTEDSGEVPFCRCGSCSLV
ncbi:hypothetical protein F0562_028613 [Nyssa sinensis]|uniref:E3 ubiquitin-protein ligase RMA n=1 Tax=Nyssa sinensis TaxID=561372 RepID=A0A5J5AYH8_9ASTE|nr:hypothetical protein F0562_028613 [Nyssa sinensis]